MEMVGTTQDIGIGEATDWSAVAASDPTLRTYVAAEIARAEVDALAWKCEALRWKDVAMRQGQQLDELRPRDDRRREVDRQRQVRHRRRHQAVPPMTEGMG